MNLEKAKKIQRIYNYSRVAFLVIFFLVLCFFIRSAEAKNVDENKDYLPKVHGTIRGKFEYEPDLNSSRFEVRNARVSVSGGMPLKSYYKAEVDLSDEGTIKMLDAYVSFNPYRTLFITVGQMRVPYTIDAHRSPHTQYFANRSFIAKQVGNVRDVGMMIGYTFTNKEEQRPIVKIEGGLFNGSGLTEQKKSWHKDVNFSAKAQFFPFEHWGLVTSVQRNRVVTDSLHYLSFDFGSYYYNENWHVEGEALRKIYQDAAFTPCNSYDFFVEYRHPFRGERESKFFQGISYLARYDYMDDHSNGSKGLSENKYVLTDAERHRMTLGITFHQKILKKIFADLRLNFEKYWYPNDGMPKESEQDKLVAELMIHF